MGHTEALAAAKNQPDRPCTSVTLPCAKPACPDGCSKVPKITARQASYTLVLDKAGAAWAGYPVLEFEITDGCPNHYIDIQVARKDASKLSGGPGIAGSWKKTDAPKDRIMQLVFSSWANGDTSLKLDGGGRATYTMPLDWWRDLARLPRAEFTMMQIHFRVLSMCDPTSGPRNSAVARTDIKNNLKTFTLTDNGYTNGGTTKSIEMKFTVEVDGTTEMYTFVQWKRGGRQMWDAAGTVSRPSVRDYGIIHQSNYPDWTLDRVGTNPRYWDGNYNHPDLKTAIATDGVSNSIPAGVIRWFGSIDFETRVHLNTDVPASLTVTRRDGAPPVYDIVMANIAPPVPLILDNAFWNMRVLLIRDVRTGVVAPPTHPNTYP